MTKKHFIALADAMRRAEPQLTDTEFRSGEHKQWERDIIEIAGACHESNPAFNTERWIDYIKGKCGVNGGKVK
jgi:hypothetical protein